MWRMLFTSLLELKEENKHFYLYHKAIICYIMLHINVENTFHATYIVYLPFNIVSKIGVIEILGRRLTKCQM